MHKPCSIIALCAIAFTAMPASSQLPPPTPEEKAQAAEIAARNAWKDKVGAYQLCQASHRIAQKYRAQRLAQGEKPPDSVATPPCTDPGSYRTYQTGNESKPLEAAESHSPAGTMIAPHNTRENEKETRAGQGE